MKDKLSPEDEARIKAEKRERFLAIRQSGKPKGVPTKALAKVSHLQLSTWESFTEFINNEGLDLFKENLMQLDPKSYIIAYLQLLEFIKPKLTRAQIVEEKTIQVNDVTFE
jgi:hypothetical protein